MMMWMWVSALACFVLCVLSIWIMLRLLLKFKVTSKTLLLLCWNICFSPTSFWNSRFFMLKNLVVGMQIILDQLTFDKHLVQFFSHCLSPCPRLEKMLKWMSHGVLYTSPTSLLCDKNIMNVLWGTCYYLSQTLTYKVTCLSTSKL